MAGATNDSRKGIRFLVEGQFSELERMPQKILRLPPDLVMGDGRENGL